MPIGDIKMERKVKMNKMIWCLLLFFTSCTTKRKLSEASAQSNNNEKILALLQNKEQSLQQYATTLDSSDAKINFKIYPKGSFTISQNGFVGNADSIVWHGNIQQVKKGQQWQQQNQNETKAETFKEKKMSNKQQTKSALQRLSFTWWPLWLSLSVFVLYWFYRKYF